MGEFIVAVRITYMTNCTSTVFYCLSAGKTVVSVCTELSQNILCAVRFGEIV